MEEDPEPQTGRTYRLSFKDHPHWLIGSTISPLASRKGMYWRDATAERRTTPVYQLIREVGRDGFDLIEIDYHIFQDIKQLRAAEQALIVEHRDELKTPYCLNVIAAAFHPDGHRSTNEERCRAWIDAHPEREIARKKAYHAAHKEKMNAKATAYYAAHRDEINGKTRARRAAKKAAAASGVDGAAAVDRTPVKV